MEVVTIATRYGDICIEDVVKNSSRGHSFAIARAQRCRRENKTLVRGSKNRRGGDKK